MSKLKQKPRTWHYSGQKFSIKPSYVVSKPMYVCSEELPPRNYEKTNVNLKDNTHGFIMSPQSQKKIRTAIDWLCAAAVEKFVPATSENAAFYFKVNFITLTLPAFCPHINHVNFYKELVHPFLVYARKYFALNNYVWKMELQKNGNPHLHLTTDTYIHWRKIRSCWNRILKRKQCLDIYRDKHFGIKFEKYLELYPPTDLVDVAKSYERWQYGNKTNWEDPNTTDVHATKNINNIAAYLCKYMAKNMTDNKDLFNVGTDNNSIGRFRMWSCNKELSAMFVTSMEIYICDIAPEDGSILDYRIASKPIFSKPNAYGEIKKIAEVFYIKDHQWGKIVKGKLYDKFVSVKKQLRLSYVKPLSFKPFSKN